MASNEKAIALTDGTVTRRITWTSQNIGPVGSEAVSPTESQSYGEVPLADNYTFYPNENYSYSERVDDGYDIATGYSGSFRRE
jgi:hypothetical protein